MEGANFIVGHMRDQNNYSEASSLRAAAYRGSRNGRSSVSCRKGAQFPSGTCAGLENGVPSGCRIQPPQPGSPCREPRAGHGDGHRLGDTRGHAASRSGQPPGPSWPPTAGHFLPLLTLQVGTPGTARHLQGSLIGLFDTTQLPQIFSGGKGAFFQFTQEEAWALAGDRQRVPSAVSLRWPPQTHQGRACHWAPVWAQACGLRALLSPPPPSPHHLSAGEGLLEPRGPHGGPTLPVRGDAHHGGGHGLDLPAGRLQHPPTAALPRGRLLLPGAGQALHLEHAAGPSPALLPGQFLWGFWWGFWPQGGGPPGVVGVPKEGRALLGRCPRP